jgi:hypothetical protein
MKDGFDLPAPRSRGSWFIARTPGRHRANILIGPVVRKPLTAANDPPAPLPLRQVPRIIDQHVTDYLTQARIAA